VLEENESAEHEVCSVAEDTRQILDQSPEFCTCQWPSPISALLIANTSSSILATTMNGA
jgi:hypothetical protein